MGANRLPAFPAPSFIEGEAAKQSSGETRREDEQLCLSMSNGLVPRTQRSVSSTVRCRAGAHASAVCVAFWVPALRSCMRTLQRVRDTRGTRVVSHTPSLRAQRSKPESFRGGTLDCFAPLAMTVLMQLRQLSPHRRPGLVRNCARGAGTTLCVKPACPYTASTPSGRRPPGTPGR